MDTLYKASIWTKQNIHFNYNTTSFLKPLFSSFQFYCYITRISAMSCFILLRMRSRLFFNKTILHIPYPLLWLPKGKRRIEDCELIRNWRNECNWFACKIYLEARQTTTEGIYHILCVVTFFHRLDEGKPTRQPTDYFATSSNLIHSSITQIRNKTQGWKNRHMDRR